MDSAEPTEDEKQNIERGLKIRRFSDAEMRRRIKQLQKQMSVDGLDAMLFSDEVNVVYLTGMLVPSFATRTRPIIVFVPHDGEPILVCSRSQAANARSASAIQDIRPFERFEDDALHVVINILNELVPKGGRIGCETGREQRIGLSVNGFNSLVVSVPSTRFVDGSASLWPVRLVKSDEEINVMKQAGHINHTAMRKAFEVVTTDTSEQTIRNTWALEISRQGAERPGYLAIHSGAGSYRRISSVATDRKIQLGDLIWMDGGPVYKGYWSDVTRMISVGPASPADKFRYSFAWETVKTLVDMVKPGVTAGDIARKSARIFAKINRPMGGASRIGHGIGLELTEPPSLNSSDETVLVPGMTISIETGLADWDGYFLMEMNLVITESGRELLSPPAPETLPELL